MRIGALAQRSGVDIDTIRYYEKAGLLPAPPRQANGYRTYGPAHLERLAFVRHCRALDMPLADIQTLLKFVEAPEADCGNINALIEQQLTQVRARLRSMQRLERQLVALRASCGEHHPARACGILHELVAAAHDEACVCHQSED